MSRSASAPVPLRRITVAHAALAALAILLGTVTHGCASAPAPAVPVTGSAQELAALAGTWEGEYSSDATGRRGSIRFTLRSATDSAFGDVVMLPAGAARPLVRASPGERAGAERAGATPTEVLRIRFVRAANGRVTGSLDPSRAPNCDCTLTTTFSGELRGDVIEGTFVTTGDVAAPRQSGRWRVTRR
jgi:hypothetical protein